MRELRNWVGAIALGLCAACGQSTPRCTRGTIPENGFPMQDFPPFPSDLVEMGKLGESSDDPEMTGALDDALKNARQWQQAWSNLVNLGSQAQAAAFENALKAARAEAARVAERLAAYEQLKALAELFRRLADTEEVYRYTRKGSAWTLYIRNIRKGAELKRRGTWVFSGIAFRTYHRPVPGCARPLYACPTRATVGKSIPVAANPVSAETACSGGSPEEALGFACSAKIPGRAENPLRIYEHRRQKLRNASGVAAEQSYFERAASPWSPLGVLGYVP